jgi:hypothetical protein
MPTALHIAGLSSQSHPGVGARLVRRLGGAVRSVIVRGITLAGTLRRPAVPQTRRRHPAAQDPPAPAPTRLRAPNRPRAALPAPLLPSPLLAHLLAARRQHRPAAAGRPAFLNQGDKPFTPEAFPQLSPKACAVLNTPLKDCDPRTLELLVSTFTQYVIEVMSPEADIRDPQAVLPNLWHRLSTALGDTKADTSLPATPEAVPAAPADAMPDASLASPHPPAPPARLWTNDAPRPSPLPPSDAPITAAAPRTSPDIVAPSAPVAHRCRSFRFDMQSFARRRWCRFRSLFPRGLRDGPQCLPPPYRLYYAACTGPPRGIVHRIRRISEAIERGHRTAVPPSLHELIA